MSDNLDFIIARNDQVDVSLLAEMIRGWVEKVLAATYGGNPYLLPESGLHHGFRQQKVQEIMRNWRENVFLQLRTLAIDQFHMTYDKRKTPIGGIYPILIKVSGTVAYDLAVIPDRYQAREEVFLRYFQLIALGGKWAISQESAREDDIH